MCFNHEKRTDLVTIRVGPTLREILGLAAQLRRQTLSSYLHDVLADHARLNACAIHTDSASAEVAETVQSTAPYGSIEELLEGLVTALRLRLPKGPGGDGPLGSPAGAPDLPLQ